MKRNIKIICRGYRPNTAWMSRLIAYAKAYAKLGHKVVFIFLIPDKNRTIPNLEIEGVSCLNLWNEARFQAHKSQYITYVQSLVKIKKYIENGDICMFTDASGFFIRQVLSAKKDIKVIFESTEHPAILNRTFNKKIELALFYKKLLRVDYIFVITNKLKQHYIHKGIDEKKIHVVNMFVDPSRFLNIEKNTNEKNIAYCGSVSCVKDGVDILIQAFDKFRKHHPEYKLNIYGSGTDDVMNHLKCLCEEFGLVDSVIFWGMVPSDQIPQRLKNATILALSRPDNVQSTYGFPTKLGEYLATANPVVITSVGEIPNFITDGVNGYIATPGDAKSFYTKLIEAASALEYNNNVGNCGQELVFSEFNPYIQVERISEILG